MTDPVITIDTHYGGQPRVAAAYLLPPVDPARDEVAFVETNTSFAVPRLLQALHDAGYHPEQVRFIAITHIHLDHAGGAGQLMAACPNATLLAHPKAAPHAIDPSRIVAGATAVYGEETFAALYGEILPVDAGRVRVMEHTDTVTCGGRTLTAWHTRGHANHHLVLHDDVGDTVFTGDSFGLMYPSLQGRGPFGVPSTSPTDFDAEAAHASIDRIVALGAARVHPTHFGPHTAIAELAGQLHRLLDAHAMIVEQAERDGVPDDALDAMCRDGVRAAFTAAVAAAGLDTPATWDQLALDIDLNAQGLAFAVRKRRFKRSTA